MRNLGAPPARCSRSSRPQSSSAANGSSVAPQTDSTASSVKPPAKTARRANSACCSSVRSSWLQSIVARSVRCLGGRSAWPPARTSSGRSSLARISSALSSLTRAAASSSASGIPSSALQIPTRACAFAPESANCGSTARARAVNTAIESFRASSARSSVGSGTGSGGTGYSCSPEIRRGTRLVTRSRSRGAACRSRSRTGAALTRRSKLSRTTSASRVRSSRASVSSVSSPGCSPISRAEAIAEPSRPGSTVVCRSTKNAPSASSWPNSAAAAMATRVLPTPPGPVSVSSATSRSRSDEQTAATSRPRPTSRVVGVGKRRLPPDTAGSSDGSWRRMARSSSRTSGLGSIPSSSASVRRVAWNAARASACLPAR